MYLIDAGFKIEVEHEENHNICDYDINISKKEVFSWEEIKYDFITFIEILKKQYIISSIYFRIKGINSYKFRHGKSIEVSVSTILKEGGFDKILQKFNNNPIHQIEIKVR